MTIHYEDASIVVHEGDCLDVLRGMPDASVDAVVTDPPAGILFMNRSWDDAKGGRDQWVAWLADVMREALRVTKPGGHALVWALPRTSHWTACGIEDAGWEIRDRLTHLFGSGFPKSLDVGKAIDKRPGVAQHAEFAAALRAAMAEKGYTNTFDVAEAVIGRRTGAVANWQKYQFPEAKWWPALRDLLDMDDEWGPVIAEAERARTGTHLNGLHTGDAGVGAGGVAQDRKDIPSTDAAKQWDGWGTALKPGAEDWWLARKPLAAGTVAGNVLRFGTGALNIDACRIGTDGGTRDPGHAPGGPTVSAYGNGLNGRAIEPVAGLGRWPANVVLDGRAAAALDTQSGDRPAGGKVTGRQTSRTGDSGIYGAYGAVENSPYDDTGGASRFFLVAADDPLPIDTLSDRFRYVPKADASERPRVDGVAHATVKPLDLMRWLVKLVTPPGGTCLDPFAGSGTTVEACILEGFRCVAIEREAEYLPLIEARVTRRRDPVRHIELTGGDLGLFDLGETT